MNTFSKNTTLVQLFEEQVRKTPQNIAVEHNGSNVNYAKLDKIANHFANALREKGVKKNDVVCVFMSKSIYMVASVLAIIKLGGTFLMVNKNTPLDRIERIINQVNPKLIITSEQLKNKLSAFVVKSIVLDELSDFTNPIKETRTNYTKPRDIAGVVYTSGSMGEPKGVMITHEGIINNAYNKINKIKISAKDVFSLNLSVEFVGFVWQLFTSLIVGAKLVIIESKISNNPLNFFRVVREKGVSLVGFTPSYLNLYLSLIRANNDYRGLTGCRFIFLVGEKAHNYLLYKYFKKFRVPIMYIYGETENSGMTTYNIIKNKPKKRIIEGMPIENTDLHIFDNKKEIISANKEGELFVSGKGLSGGYINDSKRTNEVFLPHPFMKNKFIYKTGDRAKMFKDGQVEILGRIDSLIKVKGYRVDPVEIEINLRKIKEINEVIVLKTEKSKNNSEKISAVYTTHNHQAIDIEKLRSHLMNKIPDYCIPQQFVFLNEIPLRTNGKIDNYALQKIIQDNIPQSPRVKSRSRVNKKEIEKKLINIWKKILSVDQMKPDENWFNLGANSLSISRAYDELNKEFPNKIKLADLFRCATVIDLILLLNGEQKRVKDCSREQIAVNLKTNTTNEGRGGDIAIIGMAVRVPRAKNYRAFWNNIIRKRNCIRNLSGIRKDDMSKYSKYTQKDKFHYKQFFGCLDRIDEFDHHFFNIPHNEANLINPNERLFMETAVEAIEDAGINIADLRGTKTGIYLGYASQRAYYSMLSEVGSLPNPIALMGNIAAMSTGRLSHFLDIKGNNMVIDTACSSSLVAIHQACLSIRGGDCDQIIAGGIRLYALPLEDNQLGIESSDGQTRSFDEIGDGTNWGEGVGAVLLKPLEKAIAEKNHIYAIIKGSAINHDGRSLNLTAPNIVAQEEVICSAWESAGVDPATISHLETHGTGTKLGDPVEIGAITQAFRHYTPNNQFCAIGSIKANIGHAFQAAGIISLIKTSLALTHKEIPPSILFKTPNQKIEWKNSPVFVNTRLKKWRRQNKATPLRCGISSFGISGTNCHMVLEEAPIIKSKIIIANSLKYPTPNILVLSAKTKVALKRLVRDYNKYIIDKENKNIPLANICYTSQTGREHYSHRLALIAKNKEYLERRLKHLLEIDMNFFGVKKLKDIYYHYIYSTPLLIHAKREDGYKNEITEREIVRLTRKINDIFKTQKEDKKSITTLKQIAEYYANGANPNWDLMYSDEKPQKVSLPTYPFESTRCWIDIPKHETRQKNVSFKQNSIFHPLLEKCLSRSIDQDIYTTEFSAKKHFVLSDHVALGRFVIPGTAYLEMAKQISNIYYPSKKIVLKNVIFITPAVFKEDETRTIQMIVKRKKNYLKFIVAGKPEFTNNGKEQDGWTRYAEGEIHQLNEIDEPANININKIKNECGKEMLVGIYQKENSNSLIRVGPRWPNNQKLRLGKDSALAEISLSSEFKKDLNIYFLHPALLDATIVIMRRAVSMLRNNEKDEMSQRLPLGYGNYKIRGPIPDNFYCYFRVNSFHKINFEISSIDLLLINKNGKIFGEITDFYYKKVTDFNSLIKKNEFFKVKKDFYPHIFYKPKWILTSDILQAKERSNRKGCIILFQEDLNNSLTELIKKNNKDSTVIKVNLGSKYQMNNIENFTIRNQQRDYNQLISDIKDKNILQIIHTLTLNNTGRKQINSLSNLKQRYGRGVKSLLYLVKAIQNNKIIEKIDIVLVSRFADKVSGKEPVINPENASYFGLGKTVYLENPNLKCRAIDIDEKVDIKKIVKEIITPCSYYKVAYRDNKRYTEILDKLLIKKIEDKKIDIKKDKVYIITGGIGGIGLEVAKYLIKKAPVKLVLINRSKLFLKNKANLDFFSIEKQQANPLKEKQIRALEIITHLKSRGADIYTYSCDVADENKITNIITEIRNKFGRIDGVIHAAGIAGDGLLINKDEKVFDDVLAPKFFGTWLLYSLTRKDNLDFFINFSSITSLFGAPGQGDYTAANAFLDSFSNQEISNKTESKRTKLLTINWGYWDKIGMTLGHGIKTKKTSPMSPDEAIKAFDLILNKKIENDNIVVAKLNFPTPVNIMPISEHINQTYSNVPTDNTGKERDLFFDAESKDDKNKITPVYLNIQKKEKYSKFEERLLKIWRKVLDSEKININDRFFEIGGDSLLILQIQAEISNKLNIKLPVMELFNHPTIKDLARYIENQEKTVNNFIKPVIKKRYYETSYAQKRIWVMHKIEPNSTLYNRVYVNEIKGQLNIPALEKAIQTLIDRHDAFRTNFIEFEESKPMQIIRKEMNVNLKIINLTKESKETKNKRKKEIINNILNTPYDLAKDKLLRTTLIKFDNSKFVFIMGMNHIIYDVSSLFVLYNELNTLYNAYIIGRPSPLPPLTIQYKDFAEREQSREYKIMLKTQEKYWLKQLGGELPILNLPTDKPRPKTQTYNGREETVTIDKILTGKLNKLANDNEVTLFMLILTIFKVFLGRITGQQDIIVGTYATTRDTNELENILGILLNNIVIRSNLTNNPSFIQFLRRVRQTVLDGMTNKEYPFEHLVDKINPPRDQSRFPIFNVLFQLFFNESIEKTVNNFGKLSVKRYSLNNTEGQFDLTFRAVETKKNELLFVLRYNTDLFKSDTIKRFLTYLKELCQSVADNPERTIGDLNLISKEEKYKLLNKFNNTKSTYHETKTIHAVFEEQVQKMPDNIAIRYGNKKLSYKQLNQSANQLAYNLIKLGTRPEKIIALILDRSLEMIISILAIFKAGGAYLPIDPRMPVNRIKYLLKDSRAKIVITQKNILAKLKFIQRDSKNIQLIDVNSKTKYEHKKTNPNIKSKPNNLAYLFYTSGSTGKPKGVMVEHRSVINLLTDLQYKLNMKTNSRILSRTNNTFDVSITELIGANFSGATQVIIKDFLSGSVGDIIQHIQKYKVTHINFVPTLFNKFVKELIGKNISTIKTLKHIILAGEMIDNLCIAEFFKLNLNIKLYNYFGPTEATIYSTGTEIKERISNYNNIGRPLANIQCYIFNENKNIVPLGIPGELYISGLCLARGYINNQQRTNKVFLPHPFLKNKKIYKTGDSVRMCVGGSIEILGRIDRQIKVRGFRVEPGEIEICLRKIKSIKDVLVTKHQKEELLVVYYTRSAVQIQSIDHIKLELRKHLPDYMIPTYFIHLKKFPLNSSGKINRRALPKPSEKHLVKAEFSRPQGLIEEELTRIWQEVLRIKNISRNDNFFDLGGNSLKLIAMHTKLVNIYGDNSLNVQELFENRILYDMSKKIEDKISGNSESQTKYRKIKI